MNCKEFKDKVVDLFDTTIDMQTQAECKAHMAECPECKAYYEELAEAFNALQPQETSAQPSISRPVCKQHHLQRTLHLTDPLQKTLILWHGCHISAWTGAFFMFQTIGGLLNI